MKKILIFCLILPAVATGELISGDANGDGVVNIGDVAFQVDYLYNGGLAPNPLSAGDANGDARVDRADASHLADLIFGDVGLPASPPAQESNSIACDILMIGSSYFGFNDLPGMLREMMAERNKDVDILATIQGGLYLADHAEMATTENLINARNWNYVILQGVGIYTAYPDSFPTQHPVYPALATLHEKIQSNCSWTKTVFCLPFAFEDGMIWVNGWTDEYPEMQEKAYLKTLEYSNDLGLVISPVGWSWNTVLREQGYPLHYLHLSDWNHPSLRGSYLMACTIFSTIFRESTAGIEYSAGLSAEEALYYQSVGSAMVLDSLELWNLPGRVIPPPPADRHSDNS